MDVNGAEIKKTPLYREHLKLGARMVPFSGWEMPVSYPAGIIAEHLHTRRKAGLFDICHMGEFLLSGDNAYEDLARLFTADIRELDVGGARYGFFLNEQGCFIDDLIVFRRHRDAYMLVVNASRSERDREWLERHISAGSRLEDISENTGKIDIQGPLAESVLGKFLQPGEKLLPARFRSKDVVVDGVRVFLSRTGYTGEVGFELFCDAGDVRKLWRTFIREEDVAPVGLGARDTLRLEMGYPLYGSDIDVSHTPRQAGLMRFVDMRKDFMGKEALLGKGIERVLKGFATGSKRSARRGFKVISGDREVGEVTSASYSPSLERGIGLCYLQEGTIRPEGGLAVSDGKRSMAIEITALPFYTKNSNQKRKGGRCHSKA